LAISGCETHFKSELRARKPIEIDMDKLRTKCLTMNVDFDGLSLDFLDSRKPAHESIKERYFVKVATKWLEID